MTLLCDTNVLSELARPAPNPGVLAWAAETKVVSISAITIDEVVFGLTLRPNIRVQAWFEDFLANSCQVLDVTPAVARLAGAMRARLAARGQVRTQADMLIAASAAAHGLTVVTRNTKDFTGCGISVLNPFRPRG
ncbi:MAG TPA: type II toxin-antitoxin system VapC family toxin [Polyangia bacterium]